jgi:flagellar hook assembly protein FlgD
LERPAPISLAIHDTAGRRVAILVADENRPAGEHSVVWDGRDASGREVASGIYLVRMKTEAFSATVKVLVLK